MKEENNFNPVEPVIPVQPTEQPVQPVMQTPVEPVTPVQSVIQTPVEPQPVQPVIQDVNFNPQPPKKSPAKTILILLLTAIVIGGASYGGYQYYSSTIENKTKGNDVTETTTTTESTTTTTTKKVVKLLDLNSIDAYINYVKSSNVKEERISVINQNSTFYDINYDLENKCKTEGQEVSFKVKEDTIKYTCKLDTEYCRDGTDNCTGDNTKEWEADVVVNDKYKIKKSTFTTCVSWKNMTNKKYFLNFEHGCAVGASSFRLESVDNKTIFDGKYEYHYINNSSYEKQINTPMIIKDDVIYFIDAVEVPEDTMSTCKVKAIDLNKDEPTVQELSPAEPCYYTFGA